MKPVSPSIEEAGAKTILLPSLPFSVGGVTEEGEVHGELKGIDPKETFDCRSFNLIKLTG